MNYTSFLKQVDERLEKIDLMSLRMFAHEIARTLPEENRDKFLTLLSDFLEGKRDKLSAKISDPSGSNMPSLSEKVSKMIDKLQEIADDKYALESEYYGGWDDWKSDEEIEDEFEFSDPSGVMDILRDAFRLLHTCFDMEAYNDGARLAEQLPGTEVRITGEYYDEIDEYMDLEELDSRGLLKVNMPQAVAEAAYLVLMNSSKADRAHAVLKVLHNFNIQDVMLESILQVDETEINVDELLPDWIKELGAKCDDYSKKLVIEAFAMLPDFETKLTTATQYAATYPILFQKLLEAERGRVSDEQLLSISLTGLKLIPVDRTVRSAVALQAAEYALALGRRSSAEKAWLEAFRSAPTVVNYLRLRLLAEDWQDFSQTVSEICDMATKPYGDISAALLFYNGEFEKFQQRFMNVKVGIGWSSTFMKQGLALFMLLLNKGDFDTVGIEAMLERIKNDAGFSCASFYTGTDKTPPDDDNEEFLRLFELWKSSVTIPDILPHATLKNAENWLSMRVSAIIDKNRTKYYGECADYIAAYGEVLESTGETGAKQRLLEQYRSAYPRRSSFIAELRRVGLNR